jgi:hypothetical protein
MIIVHRVGAVMAMPGIVSAKSMLELAGQDGPAMR